MKDLIIKNRNDIEGQEFNRGKNNKYVVKSIVGGNDIDQCEVAFIEVPVGNHAFGYHYHDQAEEVFYVVSGEGLLRTSKGEKPVKAGDIMCFPKGENGAHVLSNSSQTEQLVFIDFDVRSKIDIVTFPDLKKIRVLGEHTNVMLDLPGEE